MKPASRTSVEATLVTRVRAELAAVAGVKEKRMFGGVAFMVRGKLCVTARESRLMCRLDPARHDAAVKRAGCRTVVMGGRPIRGYVQVDAEVVRTTRALRSWLKQALAHNAASAK